MTDQEAAFILCIDISEELRNIGVTGQSSDAEILSAQEKLRNKVKSQYRKLSKEYHPDRGGSIEKMAQLNSAYEVLKNVELMREPSVQPLPFMMANYFWAVQFSYSSNTTSTTGTCFYNY